MTIEDVDVVDAMGVETSTGSIVLTISDHLDWDDEEQHLQRMEDKLNCYLRFVESGELARTYPEAEGLRPVVDVVMRVMPTPAGWRYLREAERVLAHAGIGPRTRTLSDA